MDYKQLSEILEIFKEIPETSKRDRAVQLMLQTASDSINFETLRSLLGDKEETGKKQDSEGTLLKLTEKEISKMPTRFRKEFLIGDRLVRCRRRKSGKNTTNYEIRYRKHGYNIAVSSNNLNEAIEKFIKALHDADCKVKSPTVPATFQEFAAYYFETYRKRKVTPETFKKDMCRYDKHIKPYFILYL